MVRPVVLPDGMISGLLACIDLVLYVIRIGGVESFPCFVHL